MIDESIRTAQRWIERKQNKDGDYANVNDTDDGGPVKSNIK